MESVVQNMQTSVQGDGKQPVQGEGPATLYCAYHPGRETVLRCNRCDKPICYDCAVRTPVGYRCKDCVRQQQSKYFNGAPLDALIGAAVGLVLGAVAGIVAILVSGMLGLFGFIIAFFAGPIAGGIIAEAVRWSVRRRRSRRLNVVVIVAALVGMLLGPMFLGLPLAAIVTRGLAALLFAVLAASTIYARLQ